MTFQPSLFGEAAGLSAGVLPAGTRARHRILITVKAAPNPSEKSGETVCVAGIRIGDVGPLGWIRLYPLNLRHIPSGSSGFRKYDIVSVNCVRAGEPRPESWNPDVQSLEVEQSLPPWDRRRPLVDPLIKSTMCHLHRNANKPGAESLGLLRPHRIIDFVIESHPGWSASERAKVERYANQFSLFDQDDRSALEAPRFKGFYRWECTESSCNGHRQQVLDWKFVALQRKLAHESDGIVRDALRARFYDEICSPQNDVAFYVGNQAKRHQTFSILGVYYPRR